tara:strand:+ start:155 stop:433 length:279 start_codon:yes stop_codon:yes gene_type:complete
LVSSFKLKELSQLLFFLFLKISYEEIQRLPSNAKASLNKTAQQQQALAKIEANISMEEYQKVTRNTKKLKFLVSRSFKPNNTYLRILKTTYK